MKPVPKNKPVRLTGKAYRALQIAVLERDGKLCLSCWQWTEAPPHHRVYRSQGGGDTPGNMDTLCSKCHRAVHEAKLKYHYLSGRYVERGQDEDTQD